MRTAQITRLDQIIPGTIVADARDCRSRIVGVTPNPATPDMLTYARVTLAPVDQLAGWAGAPLPQETLGGAYVREHLRILAPRPSEVADCDTEQWYTDHVAGKCPAADRSALRKVWLGS